MSVIYFKKTNHKKRFLLCLLSFFLIVIVLVISYIKRIYPIIGNISEEEIIAITSNTVREASLSVLRENPREQIEIITYDDSGNISTIQLNQSLINEVVQSVGIACQQKLAQIGILGIDVPIGSLSGFVFFAGKGPSINVKIFPVGSVNVTIKSSFTNRGINQTNHKIYLNVNSDVDIVVPGAHNSISTLAEILICDTIIIGKVPQVYLGSSVQEFDFTP